MPFAGQVAPAHGVPCAYFWQEPASHMPLVPQVVLPWATQVPDGSGAPVATFEQIPIEVASAHERHMLPQAVAQQTPCAQKVEAHSLPSEQKAPVAFLPQEFVSQVLGATQSALLWHDEKQRPPLHAKGAHGSDGGATHWPAPSHVEGPVYTFAAHRSGAHSVPALYVWHPPSPSHRPFVEQTAAPLSWQTLRGSGVAAGIGVQRPIAEGSAQLTHAPPHGPSQQTPSTQKPLAQSVAASQLWPTGFGPQLPFTQACPSWQSPSIVHEVALAPFEHM